MADRICDYRPFWGETFPVSGFLLSAGEFYEKEFKIMLLGVLSDSHGNVEALQKVAYIFMQLSVDLVLHLGDDYRDILFLEAVDLKVLAVPGLYCPEYRDPTIPNRRIENLAGVNVMMTHSPEVSKFDLPGDLAPEDSEVNLLLYGHTHVPDIKEKEGVLWVNPGHLKANDRRGHPQSYALIHLNPPQVDVKILSLDNGQELHSSVYTMH